ncbi:hypothetical protein WDW86_20930 [Bdellovibrionota bacterium FG-2]
MSFDMMVISDREEDLRFAEFICFSNGIKLHHAISFSEMSFLIRDFPKLLVYWEADNTEKARRVVNLLHQKVPMDRVFAVTDRPLNKYPELFQPLVMGNHLLRRYEDPAPVVFSKLLASVISPEPFGIGRFFGGENQTQKITLKRSGHKNAAVEAIRNHLQKHKVAPRLATQAAQATDDLIMNAVFNAPTLDNGMKLRANSDKGADFELIDNEFVDIEVVDDEELVAISVSDRFGRIDPKIIFSALSRDYSIKEYTSLAGPGSGIGIYQIVNQGFSLVVALENRKRSEVTLLFPKARTYTEFKSGFRFFSLIVR